MVQFDLKSAYHHIAIHEDHKKYLGFMWQDQHYCFAALPFGLATAPHVFTKVTRPLITHWRKRGFRAFMYFDDGTAAASSTEEADHMAKEMQQDLRASGFIVNVKKSRWVPSQVLEVLGCEVDMKIAVFRVPKEKAERVCNMAVGLLRSKRSVKARSLASFAGFVQSLRLAIGPSTSLWTRSMYSALAEIRSFEHHLHLSSAVTRELAFWNNFFGKTVVEFPMFPVEPRIQVFTYSDASNVAWGGYVHSSPIKIAHGNFVAEHQGPMATSSTWREVNAMKCVLSSLVSSLSNRVVLHRSDNQNVVRVVKNGSRVPAIHEEVIQLTELCQRHCIHLAVDWVPRDDNTVADRISKAQDASDFQLNPTVFRALDESWGPHSIDCFASVLSAQLPRYCSRFFNPGCTAVNAFTLDWKEEDCWLFPPVQLIGCVLRSIVLVQVQCLYLHSCVSRGTHGYKVWLKRCQL
ncbi:uncharacterized protein LOC135805510 [Sycon ciliatum]|uniref:uncharacterized protein LOC135805510 n=1 Tax=Sycon ciliatum TaxID=27933 RepID=UPI0031F6A2E8